MHATGYGSYREGRFPTQPHRDRHLARVILPPGRQVTLPPAQALQLFGDNSLAFGFGRFAPQFPGMVLPQLTFHARQLLLPDGLTAHTPPAPKPLDRFFICRVQPAGFHALLK